MPATTTTDDFIPILDVDGGAAGLVRAADIERLLLLKSTVNSYEVWRVQGWLRRTVQPQYQPQEFIDWVYLTGSLPGRESALNAARLLASQIASPSIKLQWSLPDATDTDAPT